MRALEQRSNPDFHVSECGPACDVVLVLDTSTSVGLSTFDLIKRSACSLVSALSIDSCDVTVGAVKFSSAAMIQFKWVSYCWNGDLRFTPKVGQIGHKLEKILVFFRSYFILARGAKMFWNLIWKSPGFILFDANLDLFGPKFNIPVLDDIGCSISRFLELYIYGSFNGNVKGIFRWLSFSLSLLLVAIGAKLIGPHRSLQVDNRVI